MSEHQPAGKKHRRRGWALGCAAWFAVLVVGGWIYVRTHPLVFNESLFSHAHCIGQAAMPLLGYASDHDGRFPTSTDGYGDALVLLLEDYGAPPYALTGPGYDSTVFARALTNRSSVPESECGRVYVQGLTTNADPDIAILFDKLPTPGGDHCHSLSRITASLCRDVLRVNGSTDVIREQQWPEFSRKQIELLVNEGVPRERAEALYAEKPKQR